MIQRIRGRAAFEQLARDGHRIRRSALWCSWCPDSSTPNPPTSPSTAPATTAVAFSLGRSLGPAVVRNRLRRRLRMVCRELDRRADLPGGLLLIGAKRPATELTYEQLRAELGSILHRLPNASRH